MFSEFAIGFELFLLASAIQLALGGFFGWLVRGGRLAAAGAEQPAEDSTQQAQEMFQRLHSLANSIGQNVGQHASRVEDINKELNQARESGDGDIEAAVLSAMAKIAESNERLQGQLLKAEQKLQDQAVQLESKMVEARTDALTGIANRRAFDLELQHRFEQYQQSHTPTCLLMMDVDHFKKFNDTYGHQAGDHTLRTVASVLFDSARSVDLVARYGGEEFAIVMPNTTMSEARRLAERVRIAIGENCFEFEGQALRVAVSCGLAEIQDGLAVADLIKRADEALYASKQAGRNCVHINDGTRCERVRSQSEHHAAPAARPEPAAEEEKPAADQSQVDSLTGMMTREAFVVDASRRLGEAQLTEDTACLMLADIDGLAKINDKHGFKLGDMVMRATSQFLNAATRPMGNHDLSSRYEADQFALLLTSCDLRSTTETAERLRRAISLCKLRVGDGDLQFTITSGVVMAEAGDDFASLMKRAEKVLQAAKAAGPNLTFVSDGRQCAAADSVFTDLESDSLVSNDQ